MGFCFDYIDRCFKWDFVFIYSKLYCGSKKDMVLACWFSVITLLDSYNFLSGFLSVFHLKESYYLHSIKTFLLFISYLKAWVNTSSKIIVVTQALYLRSNFSRDSSSFRIPLFKERFLILFMK